MASGFDLPNILRYLWSLRLYILSPSREPGSRGRVHRLLTAALIAASLAAGCAEVDSDPIVIAGAASGNFLDAMRLALEDHGTRGLLADLDTVFLEEISNRSADALALAEELATRPGLAAVVGHSNSVGSLATSQVYNQNQVVQVAPTSTAALYSEAGPYSFRMVPPDDTQGEFLAQILEERFPPGTRLGLLFVNDDYGRGLRREVLSRLDQQRIPVVVDLPHTEGELQTFDAEPVVAALVVAEVEAVLWLGRGPALNVLLTPLREMFGDIPIIGGDGATRSGSEPERDERWEGVFTTDFLDVNATPELRAFVDRFQGRFQAAAGGAEVLSYDAADLLLTAIASGATSGPAIREYLMSLGRDRPPHQGLSGSIVFDEHGDLQRGYVLRPARPEGER